jgi:hypothetical protein
METLLRSKPVCSLSETLFCVKLLFVRRGAVGRGGEGSQLPGHPSHKFCNDGSLFKYLSHTYGLECSEKQITAPLD